MRIGIPKETIPGERRVALVPELVPKLIDLGFEISIQPGAGSAAGFPDAGYLEKGARLQPDVLGEADIILKVRPPDPAEAGRLPENSILIGLLEPFAAGDTFEVLAARHVTALAMELMPRIARAQSMDAL